MKHISLLPLEYKKHKRSSRRMNIFMVAIGIVTAVVVFSYGIIKILSSIPETEFNALKAQNEMLHTQIEALKYLTKLEEDITRLGNRARKAIGNQPDWPMLFVSVFSDAPEGIKITEIEAANGSKACTMKITGTALEYTEVSLWMERMSAIEAVSDVQLRYSQLTGSEPLQTVRFELYVSVKNDKPFQLFKEGETG